MPNSTATAAWLSTALAPDYRVDRLLGVGGTAAVFLAHDVRHDRPVAVKLLRDELSATVGADRFVREIRVAARLTHPNIVPLLDSGRAENTPYYVMPFIDGESLRARLQRVGRMTLADALPIVLEVADALEYAHAAGIVHRDIKPENILLLHGHALVADFGIARAISHAAGFRTAEHTTSGIALGTPAYMSPEQAASDREIDGRSDVYSLATVLFELLAGVTPFQGPTVQALISKRFMQSAPRLASLVPDIPAHIDAAVGAALALEPADRPAGALAFARRLTQSDDGRPTDTIALLGTQAITRAVGIISNPALPSVVVLPFTNVGGDKDNEFLADGITEEIIGTLSRLRTIRVAARASSFAFKERRPGVREVADQLNVTNVLDGSVRRAGGRVRVSAELVDARSGFQLWSDRIERDARDAFEIQDDIARAIAEALSATLLHDTNGGAREAIGGEAYELYLRGRFALNKRTEAELHAAAGYFSEAMERAPEYALPAAGLADALLLLGIYGAEPPRQVMPRARSAVTHALDLDPALGEVHATGGAISALYDWDWPAATDAFRRAIALSPRSPVVWQWRAMHALLPTGRLDEARASIDRARSLDPMSIVIATSVGVVYHLTGDAAGAVRALHRAMEIDPGFGMTHYFLGGALRDAGDYAASEEAFKTAMARTGGTPEMLAGLAQTLARRGDLAAARRIGEDLTATADSRHVSPCLVAQVLAAIGDHDRAVEALELAAEARDPELVYIGVRSAYAPLRGHAAFDALRARVGV